MSKEIAEKLNHSDILEKALEIFSDQSLLNPQEGDKQTLQDLQLKRERANQLLDALSNFVEFSDRLEILSADKDKFKRADELDGFKSRLRTSNMLAQGDEELAKLASEQITKELQQETPDFEKIAMLNNFLDSVAARQAKGISGHVKLVKGERDSGGRPYGHKRQSGTTAPMIVLEREIADDSEYNEKDVIEIDPNNPEAFFNE